MMNNKLSHFFKFSRDFIPGNEVQVKLLMSSILASKHSLVEDTPGKGKTLLVKFMAQSLGLKFKRIQFTNDLMPMDILGFNKFNPTDKTFEFIQGPIFTELLLVDEINRASPRTQSALLEAMEEKRVTIDNKTHELAKIFCVLATQNPLDQVGTSPLPESQMDRFLFKFSMGNLNSEEEMSLLQSGARHLKLDEIKPFFDTSLVEDFKHQIQKVQVSKTIYQWVTSVLQMSRNPSQKVNPLSSRAGLDFIEALKAWAIIHDRDFVNGDDYFELFKYVFSHRLFFGQKLSTLDEQQKTDQWLQSLTL